jgi:hypothetical protein
MVMVRWYDAIMLFIVYSIFLISMSLYFVSIPNSIDNIALTVYVHYHTIFITLILNNQNVLESSCIDLM